MADAKKAKAKEAPDKSGGKKKSGKATAFLIMFAMCCAVPFMLPTVILLLAGLAPTYVELFVDNDAQKSGTVSVGAMNIAGLTPFVIDLWQKGQTMTDTFQILTNADSWLVILGAAAVGKLIVYAIPQALATLTLTHAESRAKMLRKNLDTLKEYWGPEVATVKPLDRIQQE